MLIQVKATTETFLWQLEGSATITYGNGEQVVMTMTMTMTMGCIDNL